MASNFAFAMRSILRKDLPKDFQVLYSRSHAHCSKDMTITCMLIAALITSSRCTM